MPAEWPAKKLRENYFYFALDSPSLFAMFVGMKGSDWHFVSGDAWLSKNRHIFSRIKHGFFGPCVTFSVTLCTFMLCSMGSRLTGSPYSYLKRLPPIEFFSVYLSRPVFGLLLSLPAPEHVAAVGTLAGPQGLASQSIPTAVFLTSATRKEIP